MDRNFLRDWPWQSSFFHLPQADVFGFAFSAVTSDWFGTSQGIGMETFGVHPQVSRVIRHLQTSRRSMHIWSHRNKKNTNMYSTLKIKSLERMANVVLCIQEIYQLAYSHQFRWEANIKFPYPMPRVVQPEEGLKAKFWYPHKKGSVIQYRLETVSIPQITNKVCGNLKVSAKSFQMERCYLRLIM